MLKLKAVAPMTIAKFYTRSVVYPGLFFIPCITLFSLIDSRNYKSEWLTSASVVQMTFVAALVYWILICILALTIFLNRFEQIRSSLVLSGLSWFLLPAGFICLVTGKAINEYLTVGTTGEIIYALLFNLPFVTGLVWGFWKFRTKS
jgi:hypothetical protein